MLQSISRRLEGRSVSDVAHASFKTIGHAIRSVTPAERRKKAMHNAFDAEWGTDTSAEITMANLEFPAKLARECCHYQASGPHALNEVMALASIDPATHTFIDIGSGKGRVVLCASAVPFRRSIGVEYSAKLDGIARRNRDIFTARGGAKVTPEFWCGDAADYALPPGPLFLYLYNPFYPAIMEPFLDRCEEAAAAGIRPITLAYLNPQFPEVFDIRPRWSREARADHTIIYRLS